METHSASLDEGLKALSEHSRLASSGPRSARRCQRNRGWRTLEARQELANRNTGQKTPSCAFDRCPCRQRLLRFACHSVPVHPEFVDCIQESLELTRVHVPFRFEEVRELAGVCLEIDLASFPFLDEFEAARVGADADTGARDHGLGAFCGASIISLCSEDGGGGEAPRVFEQFEQGLAFARGGQVLR